MTDTLQKRLKSAREEAGLSQAALAKKVGMKQPSYSELETKEDAGSKNLLEIADALGVRLRWLKYNEGPRYKGDLELSQDEEDIILIFRRFPASSQRMIVAQLKGALTAALAEEPPDA
jgi:transcriptional regulator with XRE-family HTH domain